MKEQRGQVRPASSRARSRRRTTASTARSAAARRVDIVNDVAGKAGAIIAIGSCASWGGIPSADPNPTGATGAPMILKGKTVVTIPGCPANPYNLLGTVLQYATLGTLPGARREGPAEVRVRPHDPRALPAPRALRRRPLRPEVRRRGAPPGLLPLQDSAARGRRRTRTARCSISARSSDAWPIGIGHPCFGCTEQTLAFRMPLHDTVDIERPTPPDTYRPIHAQQGTISPDRDGRRGRSSAARSLGAGLRAPRRSSAPKRRPRRRRSRKGG